MHPFLLALVLLFAMPAWAETRDPVDHFFQPKFGDLQADLSEARRQGKQGIFLFFEMDDCPFCERMKSTILNRADVQKAYREKFLVYAMDVNGGTEITDFQGTTMTEKAFAFAHRVRATPTLVFFDLEGKPVARHTGPTRDKDEFLLLGRYVAEGAYKTQPFARYKQQQ